MDRNQWSLLWPPAHPSPPVFTRQIAELPRETVHQILNDLPIIKILQILASRIEKLQDCITTHFHYQHLISTETVPEFLALFELYREIKWFTKAPLATSRSVLSRRYDSAKRNNLVPPNQYPHRWPDGADQYDFRINRRDVKESMLRDIIEVLSLQALDWEILRPFMPGNLANTPLTTTDDVQALWTRWGAIKEAKLKMGAARSSQLNIAADLIAEYPGKLMLKKPRDPSQSGPRPNNKHIENYLRTRANKAKNDRCLRHKNVRCIDGADLIPLVPYDKYLWIFLDTLEKFPIDKNNIGGNLQSLSLEDGAEEISPTVLHYPPEIRTSIDVATIGLSYLYTDMPHEVPRIQWATVSESINGKRPAFYVQRKPHPPGLPEHLHRCPVMTVKCHDEREYEWLRAFLKAVTWMEESVGVLMGT